MGRSEARPDRVRSIASRNSVAALHEVAVAAGNLADPNWLAKVAVDKALAIGPSDAAVLGWVEGPNGVFRLVASSGVAREGHAHRFEAQLAVPLLVEGAPRGTLTVLNFSNRQYTTEDATFLSLLAAIVAPALEAARLAQIEQEKLNVIIDAQRQIANSEVDVDRLLAVLSERAVALTGAGGAAVLLPDKGQMVVKAAAGTIDIPLGFAVPIDSSLAGLAFRTGEIQRTSNAREDPSVHTETARTAGLGAMVSAPLVTERGAVGVLQLISEEPGALDDADARTLQMMAGFAAAAFQRASTLRRVRDGERRVRAVIESAPDPIVVLDAEARIVDFNPAAEQAFLRSRSEVLGRNAVILLANSYADGFKRWNVAGNAANSAEYAGRIFEATGRRSDGSEFPMEIIITDLHEETRLVAAFVRDLTLRDAQRESEAKSRLMAMVNHEVRTPLNSILGFARVLKDSSSPSLTARQKRYVENIELSGSHLLDLVNDSLDVARLETGRVRVELADVSVAAVMVQAAEQVRPLAEAQGLVLDVRPVAGLVARADRRQLVQVLLNLLSNAVRHTHEGGSVSVSSRAEDGEVLLSVADTGDGISAQDQVRLFEEFFQAGNHAPGGMGLGLAISHRLAGLMQGRIEVQSELGNGSMFSIRLPRGLGGPD